MIEVIRKGSLKRIECGNCGSLLRYDANEDVQKTEEPSWQGGTYTKEFIKCPVCNEELLLSAMTR